MKKLIITDVDGVLLDWSSEFDRWMLGLGHVRPDGSPTSYALSDHWNLPEWVINHLVKEFNESSYTAFIKPYGEAGHYVKRLADRGFRFATVTSFGGNSASRALRRFNLENIFGDVFDEHNIIELHGDKTPILKKWEGTEYWWLEDNINNAKKGLDLGLRPILMRHDHNLEYQDDDMLVANNWLEIYRIITGEKEE
jgi:hypothetical protein